MKVDRGKKYIKKKIIIIFESEIKNINMVFFKIIW